MRRRGDVTDSAHATRRAGVSFPSTPDLPSAPIPQRLTPADEALVPRRTLEHDEFERLAGRLRTRSASRYERWVKPVLDRLLAAALLLLLAPMLITISVVVLVAVGRPVLLRQTRVGRYGKAFAMLKFRTMMPDRRVSFDGYTGPERRVTHKSAFDPRHTRLGRWLRKLSLDELPQLFNVLRGEMSLVGPRPELLHLTVDYLPWQRSRHLVKPGVTGLWQTTDRSKGMLLHECIDLDLEYIDGLSFRRDWAILLRTPLALLRTKGVV